MKENKEVQQYSKVWLILGIILISFSLRPSITSVGPLIPMIRADLNLSNAWAGFLTTLPLLAFATFSLFSSAIGRRLGNVRAILLGLILLAIGLLIRVQAGAVLLYLGTALTGIGIVLCNVLLIPLIMLKLPGKIGIMTSIYTTGMSLFAAVGTGISVPLALDMGLGWRGALLSWVLLVAVAILIWLPQVKKRKQVAPEIEVGISTNVWKSRLAWEVSMFMGLQSLIFFTLIAWLPDLLISKGFSEAKAGIAVSLMQVVGLSGSFLSPLIAVRHKKQVRTSVGLGLAYFIGFTLLFTNIEMVLYLGLLIVGFSLGASISLVYTLIGLRTEGATTGKLSGMAQSTGYYLAAIGPLLVGGLFDIFADWNLFIVLMMCCSLCFGYLGLKVGKDQKV